MKNNQPVTDKEVFMKKGEFIVSTTDLKGRITSVNRPFIEISGFKRSELLGKSHNVVRHPDMPPAAFEDLWNTIKADKPWSGLVKNRCKNGDFYWVNANVSPIRENHKITGYMSVRTIPSREEIESAESLYKNVNAGNATLQAPLIARFRSWYRSISITNYLRSYTALTLVLMFASGYLVNAGTSNSILFSLFAITAVSLAVAGIIFNRYITKPVDQAVKTLAQLADGNFCDWISIDRDDEFGKVLQYLKSAQIRLGYNVNETRVVAARTRRVMEALDNVNANVMLTDPDKNILYMNKSLKQLMEREEANIRKDIPDFDSKNLMGNDLSLFYSNNDIKGCFSTDINAATQLDTQIGNLHLRIQANPVICKDGRHLGAVMEWTDCYQEVVIENEVQKIVTGALQGDLNQRVNIANMDGFFKTLSENINALISVCSNVINDTINVMSSVASGNLKHEIETEYQGSFKQLKNDVNQTITKLTSVMNEISGSAQLVLSGSQEIAQGNNNLSHRTEQQAANLEETASSMEQMTATVKQNADNALQANQLASSTRQQAEEGGNVVNHAVAAMNEITESSNKIAAIISVIDEIAFQTNLLALNAAVEAARAGEQGRGFAVVASEVRNLAGRSATAAKEIKDLIEDSVIKVEEGSKLVDASGQTLEGIMTSVKKVSDIIAEIAAASQEQSEGIEQVNRAIAQMDEVTQQNAALVEEAAAASENMGDQARNLNEQVSFFNTGQTHGHYDAESQKKENQTLDLIKTSATTQPMAKTANSDISAWEEF